MENNTDKKTESIARSLLLAMIPAIITAVLGAGVSHYLTQKDAIKVMNSYFEIVDNNLSFEEALQSVYDDSMRKDIKINDLQKQVDATPYFDIKNSTLISDGLKIEDSVNKSVIIVDNNLYYSAGMLNLIYPNQLNYDSNKNTVFYNSKGENVSNETRIDLFSTNVLYDGICYTTFLPSEGNTFSMGSNTYNKGFVIADDHSLFGEGDGYALFDLQGKYSKITFDVGRTNEYEKQDVVLKVYLNNEYVEEYSLSAQSPPVQLEINLNYADNMKLEIIGGNRVKYGFANLVLLY